MKSNLPHIYRTTNLVNGKIYIGQHSGKKASYIGSGRKLKEAIAKYGRENFKCEIIECCIDQQTLNERETYWIKWHNATDPEIGYNTDLASYPQWIGGKHTEECKRLLSQRMKGNKIWLGRNHREESKAAISKKNSGQGNGMYKIPKHLHPMYIDRSNLKDEDILRFLKGCKRNWRKEYNGELGFTGRTLRNIFMERFGTSSTFGIIRILESKFA